MCTGMAGLAARSHSQPLFFTRNGSHRLWLRKGIYVILPHCGATWMGQFTRTGTELWPVTAARVEIRPLTGDKVQVSGRGLGCLSQK